MSAIMLSVDMTYSMNWNEKYIYRRRENVHSVITINTQVMKLQSESMCGTRQRSSLLRRRKRERGRELRDSIKLKTFYCLLDTLN